MQRQGPRGAERHVPAAQPAAQLGPVQARQHEVEDDQVVGPGARLLQAQQADGPRHAPDELARMETMLTTKLDVLKKVRPAFEAFYGTLDERKREALDTLFSRHRRHG